MENYHTHKKADKSEEREVGSGIMSFIRNNFSWVKDLAVILGIVGVMYLQGHYVTIEKFEAESKLNSEAHTTLIAALASMDKTMALLGRTQSDISDLSAQVKINTATLATVVQQNKVDAEYNDLFKNSATKLSEINVRVGNLESLNLQKFVQEQLVGAAQRDLRIKVLESFYPPSTLSPTK